RFLVLRVELERLLVLGDGVRQPTELEVRLPEEQLVAALARRERDGLLELLRGAAEVALLEGALTEAGGRLGALAVEVARALVRRRRGGHVARVQLLAAELDEEVGLAGALVVEVDGAPVGRLVLLRCSGR